MKKIKIRKSGASFASDAIIQIGDFGEELCYSEDAEKLARILTENIPGGTFDLLFEFLKKYERKNSTLWIEKNFTKYWNKKKSINCLTTSSE